ncbi:MAG: hypothetical protein EOS85_35235, partial [Mesorhizobium sp.]
VLALRPARQLRNSAGTRSSGGAQRQNR